jgi:two-component system, NtrC family, sensor kinase
VTGGWGIRGVLAAQVAGVAALWSGLALVLGLPLSARGLLGPVALVAVVVCAAAVAAAVAAVLLHRSVATPVERMLAAAERLGTAPGSSPELPLLGEGPGGIPRAALAFERVVAALADERSRLARKVEELTDTNRSLAQARESLLRAERLAAVGRLAAGLAHEIGNPLGAVCGYAEVARARLPADAHPDLRDALARIAEASARIDRILRELLDFARPAPARVGEVHLEAVVEAALRLARVQPRFRAVEAVLVIPTDLPPVRGDEGRLAQVLLNLLLNAGDAMKGGGRVEIVATIDGPGAVDIAVADQGPGIAPENLPRLFEPFFSTKGPGEGTGLGLATSLRMAEEMGGTLSAANGPAGGAVFRLRLPQAGAGCQPDRAGHRPW